MGSLPQIPQITAQETEWKRRQKEWKSHRGGLMPGEQSLLNQLSKTHMNS